MFSEKSQNVLEVSRTVLGNFPEISWKCLVHVLEMSQKFLGNFLDSGRKILGHFPEIRPDN